jgi:hypothetical protein
LEHFHPDTPGQHGHHHGHSHEEPRRLAPKMA